MRKLSKQQSEERDVIQSELQALYEEIDGAIAHHNDLIRKSHETIKQKVDQYNAWVIKARDFCNVVAADIRSYMEDKNDRWHESDKGVAYENWVAEWEDAEASLSRQPAPDEPEEFDEFDSEGLDTFSELAEEP